MHRRPALLLLLLASLTVGFLPGPARSAPSEEKVDVVIGKGLEWLVRKQSRQDRKSVV